MMRDPRFANLRPVVTTAVRGFAGLTAALMLGACSQSADLLSPINVADAKPDTSQTPSQVTDLQKATIFWGQEYARRPAELKVALNYARNLKAMGEKQRAFDVLQQASSLHEADPELAGEYGRLALEFDQVPLANRLLTYADNPTAPDWRVISARGTISAKQGDFKQAIAHYERALALSNNQPSVLNNLAMAHAMSGNPTKAEDLLRQVQAGGGAPPKVQQNLALVLGLQGRYAEAKTTVASASETEAVKSDTDLIKKIVKLEPKAPPAEPAPAFKTDVAVALPAAGQANAPRFRPAVSDTATTDPWTTSVAEAGASAKPAARAKKNSTN